MIRGVLGVESVTVVFVKALAQLDDLDVHIVTLEREGTKIALKQDGDVTFHRLPGSRWPQIRIYMPALADGGWFAASLT